MTPDELEKESSTAYSRWLAASHGGTPKSVTKPLYAEAVERSGKAGRDAFRHTKGWVPNGNQGVPRLKLSRTDPLNRRPNKARVHDNLGGYITDVLRHKLKVRNPRQERRFGTIAKNPKVRMSTTRKNSVQSRGVGSSPLDTPKTRVENKKAYYEANKEERAAKVKAYREANKEEIAAQRKAYREAHKEEKAAKRKAYYEANKEEIAAKNKAYYEKKKGIIKTSYDAGYYAVLAALTGVPV